MPRKKEVFLKGKEVVEAVADIVRIEHRMVGVNANVRQADKDGSGDNEKRNGLEPKKKIARPERQKERRCNPKENCPLHDDEIQIYYRQIIQKKVADEIRCMA